MRVTKWGDSLAVRIPADVAEALHIREGDEVDVSVPTQGEPASISQEEREKILSYIRAQRWQLPPAGSLTAKRQMSVEPLAVSRHEYLHLCFSGG